MPSNPVHQKRLSETLDSQMSQIIQDFVRDTKYLLKDNIVAEYLFGSYTRHTQTALSDIDILIIVKQTTPAIQWEMGGLASDYSLKYDVCISPLVHDLRVWKKNQQYHTLFYQEIMQYGIPL